MKIHSSGHKGLIFKWNEIEEEKIFMKSMGVLFKLHKN